jgi:hypothetical protein
VLWLTLDSHSQSLAQRALNYRPSDIPRHSIQANNWLGPLAYKVILNTGTLPQKQLSNTNIHSWVIATDMHEHTLTISWLTCTIILPQSISWLTCTIILREYIVAHMHDHTQEYIVADMHNHTARVYRGWHARSYFESISWLTCTVVVVVVNESLLPYQQPTSHGTPAALSGIYVPPWFCSLSHAVESSTV